MEAILGTRKLSQIGFIVKDIEVSKRKFAAFLGVEAPPTFDGGEYAVTGTTYMGKPAPDANCLMAFFDVGEGVALELIQPNGAKSTWQDFLEEHGEGIHHIAFQVKDTNKCLEESEKFGLKVLQRGKYGDGGGEYAYLDATQDLKCLLETLESY